MSLAKWHEVAASKSRATLELEPGMSWASELGVVEFNGLEAAKFLQGYLTCDTEALPLGHWQPTALCNLKGRVVANGWVAADAQGSLWLLVHHSLVEHCLTFLHKYLVFAKAEGHNRSNELVVIMGYQHPAPTTLTAPTISLNDTTDPDLEPWLSLVSPDQAIALWQQAPLLTHHTQFNTALQGAGYALVTQHSSEQFLPQMLGLADTGAIDFDKGCYLGQEIVARAQHRGAVKRQLARLHWHPGVNATASLDAAELIDANNRSLGKIINWHIAPNNAGTMVGCALAVVNVKGDLFPSTASIAATDTASTESAQTTVFQVYKIEN